MKTSIRALAAVLLLAAASLVAAPAALLFAAPAAPPVLRVPGSPDKPIDPASLLGKHQTDVRIEDSAGNTIVYHGLPLLEVLEKGGLDLKTMNGQRASAAQVVLATGRDGYTVVFSVGELTANRSNPKVFLVAESSDEGGSNVALIGGAVLLVLLAVGGGVVAMRRRSTAGERE